jgi:hypothetical protein
MSHSAWSQRTISPRFYSLISLLLGIVCVLYFLSRQDGFPYLKDSIDKLLIPHSSTGLPQDKFRDLLMFLYNQRKEHYFHTVSTLNTAINSLAIADLLALLLLYFQSPNPDLDVFGLKVPKLSIYVILPITILYFWLLFGWSVFSAIDSRQSLFHLSRAIEKTYLNDNHVSVSNTQSSKNSLEDIGIVDAWSNVFLGFYADNYDILMSKKETNIRNNGKLAKLNSESITVAISLFIIFGGLQGVSMGCAIGMIYFYRARINQSRITVIFEIIAVLYFLLSHLTFIVAMPYSALYVSSIWFSSSIFFLLFDRFLKITGKRIVLSN